MENKGRWGLAKGAPAIAWILAGCVWDGRSAGWRWELVGYLLTQPLVAGTKGASLRVGMALRG